MTDSNFMDDIDKWADMYAQAQDDGVFGDAPKPLPATSQQTAEDSFFGPQNTVPSEDIKDCDADYWNQVHDLANYNNEGGGDQLMQEAKNEAHPEAKKVAAAILSSPNPIKPTSVGKDQALGSPEQTTKNWTDGPLLGDLEDLKKKCYELECKLSTKDGLSESSPKVEKQIESLKKRIDDLSDKLSPSYWDDPQTDN